MVVNVLGFKTVEGTNKKTGKPYVGTEIHYSYKSNSVDGSAVDRVFVKDDILRDMPKFDIGDTCDIYFNRFGGVDYIGPAEE